MTDVNMDTSLRTIQQQTEQPDNRNKRLNSEEKTGESPDAKKLFVSYMTYSPEAVPRRSWCNIEMPPDDAPMVDWFKACFGKIDKMGELYSELKDSLDFYIDEQKHIKEELGKVSETTEMLHEKVADLEAENAFLKKQTLQLQEDQLRAEISRREFHVIFDGVKDTYGEDLALLYNKFVDTLNHMEIFQGCGRQVPIVRLQRLGPFIRERSRPILCQFLHHKDVQLVLRNRGQLPYNVYAKEDYPAEIENRRRLLRPIFNKARKTDHYKGKCRLTVDKLVIKGQTFTVAPINNLDKLPRDLNPRQLAEREDDETLAFFGQGSPFSNFHSAPFFKDGQRYLCNEQYIQAQKAQIFDDDIAHRRIMNCTSPYDMKKEGNHITNFIVQKWHNEAEKIAYDGCLAKFTQNGHLRQIIANSQNKTLAEASSDPFWGVGMTLDDPNILKSDVWTGRNILGKVLQRVREMLK